LISSRAATLVSVLLAVGCRTTPEEDAPLAPTAILVISLDTFRADRLDLYGYDRETAPHIRAFGEASLTFTATAAQATQTLVSHKSMLTGKYPLRLIQETTHADGAALTSLPNPTQFLINTFQGLRAEPLQAAFGQRGYRTAAFVDGGWMSRQMGFARGFDEFDEDGGGLAGILPRVYRWLEKNRDERFFLFVHAYDLHCPYVSREPYNSRFCPDHRAHIALEGKCGKPALLGAALTPNDLRAISDHYDGGIASADVYFGELITRLRALDLYDESLIVLTSDHGDSFGEHGQIGHGGLQLEQLLVPLIVKTPASWKVSPKKFRQPVEVVDVMPTIADAVGVRLPGELDGRSLLPLIERGEWDRKFLVAQTTFEAGRESVSRPASRSMLVPDRWLVVYDPGHDPAEEPTHVYDLSADPRALVALNPADSPDAARLLGALLSESADSASGPFSPLEDVPIDDTLRKQLRALGYLE